MFSWRNKLAEAIVLLAREISISSEQRKEELNWFRSQFGPATKKDLEEMEKRIMATQAELAADLKAVLEQQKKTGTEIATLQASVDAQTQKIKELEELVAAGGEISQELVDAVAAVKAQAQVIDDQIPDAPVVPPVTPS